MLHAPRAPRRLFPIGVFMVAVWPVLHRLVSRSGYASDLSDFILGALFGIGLGVTLLGLWQHRQGGGYPNGACRG
jgi:hypothetical protein